jgi:predicted neuraminidase
VRNHLESVSIFVEDSAEIARAVDEKHGVVKLASTMQLDEKPPRYLFRRRRKETDVDDLVGVGIDSAVQPVLVTVDTDHLFVNRNLIRGYRRDLL